MRTTVKPKGKFYKFENDLNTSQPIDSTEQSKVLVNGEWVASSSQQRSKRKKLSKTKSQFINRTAVFDISRVTFTNREVGALSRNDYYIDSVNAIFRSQKTILDGLVISKNQASESLSFTVVTVSTLLLIFR